MGYSILDARCSLLDSRFSVLVSRFSLIGVEIEKDETKVDNENVLIKFILASRIKKYLYNYEHMLIFSVNYEKKMSR